MPRPPPPGAMDKRPVRRVHQPDNRMVDRGGEFDVFDKPRRAALEAVDIGDLRCGRRIVAKEHPDVALHLAGRIIADPDAPGGERLVPAPRPGSRCSAPRHQTASRDNSTRSRTRRNARQSAACRDAGRCRAAQTGCRRRRGRSATGSPSITLPSILPRFEASTRDRVVPRLAQWGGAVLRLMPVSYLLRPDPHGGESRVSKAPRQG